MWQSLDYGLDNLFVTVYNLSNYFNFQLKTLNMRHFYTKEIKNAQSKKNILFQRKIMPRDNDNLRRSEYY